ncbi:hypothetical protein AAFF_G00009080 [Aldrovandia affinis]|uniref:Uncharacterized protein n=1 Tax=Aldrovandia affinis TaxID=143900 RepID=A0AAD7T6F2_9TELE|nr:hypothetical protein AAFF_G00009080 [Aldrovandia affinis]
MIMGAPDGLSLRNEIQSKDFQAAFDPTLRQPDVKTVSSNGPGEELIPYLCAKGSKVMRPAPGFSNYAVEPRWGDLTVGMQPGDPVARPRGSWRLGYLPAVL